MQKTFLRTVGDETLRIELGSAVLSDLAVENLELSTPARTRAVRRSVIQRRAPEARSVTVARLAVVAGDQPTSTGSRRAA